MSSLFFSKNHGMPAVHRDRPLFGWLEKRCNALQLETLTDIAYILHIYGALGVLAFCRSAVRRQGWWRALLGGARLLWDDIRSLIIRAAIGLIGLRGLRALLLSSMDVYHNPALNDGLCEAVSAISRALDPALAARQDAARLAHDEVMTARWEQHQAENPLSPEITQEIQKLVRLLHPDTDAHRREAL